MQQGSLEPPQLTHWPTLHVRPKVHGMPIVQQLWPASPHGGSHEPPTQLRPELHVGQQGWPEPPQPAQVPPSHTPLYCPQLLQITVAHDGHMAFGVHTGDAAEHEPHWQFVPHDSEPHRLHVAMAFGAQTPWPPHVPLDFQVPEGVHVSLSVPQLPQVTGLVCKGAHTPLHALPTHVWSTHGTVASHSPPALHVWVPLLLGSHRFEPGVQTPVQVPELHTNAHGPPVLSTHAPLLLQVCGWLPLHCTALGAHVPQLPELQTVPLQIEPLVCQFPFMSHFCGC
jgi:hypothetical protein